MEEMPPTPTIVDEIHRQLVVGVGDDFDGPLSNLSRYYFDGRGKSIRPRLTETVSEAVNAHLGLDNKYR